MKIFSTPCHPIVHIDGRLELKEIDHTVKASMTLTGAVALLGLAVISPIYALVSLYGVIHNTFSLYSQTSSEQRIRSKISHLTEETAPQLVAKRISKLEKRIASLEKRISRETDFFLKFGRHRDTTDPAVIKEIENYMAPKAEAYERLVNAKRDRLSYDEEIEKIEKETRKERESLALILPWYRAMEEKKELESATHSKIALDILKDRYEFSLIKSRFAKQETVSRILSYLAGFIPLLGMPLSYVMRQYTIKPLLVRQDLPAAYEKARKYEWLKPLTFAI